MENRKIALVTGGSRGIGRAVCLALAKSGADVAVNYAGKEEAAQQTCRMCEELGARTLAIQADVADNAQVNAMVDQVIAQFGRLDILVCNAGITRDNLLMRMAEQDFDQVIATNLKGVWNCMKAVCRPMMKQRWGRIVSMSSVVGVAGNAGQVNYAASKAGVIGMTKSLARELGSRGVTVNAIAPGFIETDMTAVLPENIKEGLLGSIPLGRLGQAEEVAALAAFLCSEQAGYITGQVIHVDGGMAM
ncbi:MAG TPA: 3-oxoacyl-[acyl-carrier-protein] reductase [Firmicutes bacterium]|nr:3-oxoacyl-[acyl-carrier-protein] reductase [Bacillota bacterium]